MKAINIIWDLDDGDSDYALPKEVKFPNELFDDGGYNDDVADYLSNEYGYCVSAFDIVD